MRHLKAVLHTSNDIARQVRDLLGATIDQIDVVGHLPTYFDKSQFASIPLPTSAPRPPFRVFFIGRIETNKGVYDLVEMARRLDSQRKGAFHFDICGDGGELGNLRKQVCDLNLQDVVSCHGFCSSKVVSSLLGASHTVIVPTRSSYEAGFEMTCAEAILANRPLIASPVCPALEYVRGAAVEVEPDNVDQYCEAILKLCDDEQYYTRKVLACADLQKQFYDVKNSWGIKLKEILAKYILNETATSAPADANYTL